MKLKHGKKYETADGVVLEVYEKTDLDIDWVAYESFGDMGCYYDAYGVARGLRNEYNLIRRHYTKPQPAHKLDLKPGDVVELVAWEDGCDVGAVGKTFDVGLNGPETDIWEFNQHKGERPLFRVVSRVSSPMPPS